MLNVNYEQGLTQLRELVQRQKPELLSEFNLFELRLIEALQQRRLYGQSSNNDVERNQVLHHLMQFADEHFSLQFIDLCRSDSPRDDPLPDTVAHASAADLHAGLWKGGSEASIQERRYIIYEPVETSITSDQSALLQRARALEIKSQHMVQLKQVQVRCPTAHANAWKTALEKEERLLNILEQQSQAFPRCLTFEHTSRSWTLVSSDVSGRSWQYLFAVSSRPSTMPSIRSLVRSAILLCEILKVLHMQNVAYRALTPEKIFVLDGGRTLLQDTGLATWRYEPGEGSALYRAPEQSISNKSRTLPGPHTDVYQLGMILYHLITGNVPTSPQHMIPLHVWNAKLPAELDVVLQRAMVHNVKERWRTISEMSFALRKVIL